MSNTKRNIEYIVVHCTATPTNTTMESIKRYWKETLKWNNPGYHYIIHRDGRIEQLLDESQISNGVKGFNPVCVNLSYIGGVDKNNNPTDNRNRAQEDAMFNLIVHLTERYPKAKVCGHRDFPNVHKACPSFDVKQWLANYEPKLG
ncbi:MAG: N-acetylmuramoyl-L-alanine amidase [Bacteroidia bacterium]|nr:N-acetylmuramoyl-L-alanine amidase [Bacteroidia bacterium]